jgi:hypothetical protein
LVDVSFGLLDPVEAPRFEHWLDWWADIVNFGELRVSKSLVASLEDGSKKWGQGNQEVSQISEIG